jgi:hypothetical protein
MEKYQKGDIVRHFKRETVDPESTTYLYRIVGVATHSETREKMMVYEALYGERGLYVRPYKMFMSEVDHEKYPEIHQKLRFAPAEEKDLKVVDVD